MELMVYSEDPEEVGELLAVVNKESIGKRSGLEMKLDGS